MRTKLESDLELHPVLPINVGPLNGLGSLCIHTARELKRYTELYKLGAIPEVEWDLRQVEAGHMSMSGLTAFLAVAARMRQFSGHAQTALVRHKPRVFAFWDDIRFLRITRELDLLEWAPEHIVGGYGMHAGKTNPNSMILPFLEPQHVPQWHERAAWTAWKDESRQRFTHEFLRRCGRIFDANRSSRMQEKRLSEQVAKTAAELVLNAHSWGRAPAFAGLQRSTVGITVAVCDAGRGFKSTLCEQSQREHCPEPDNHIEAILLGCFLNRREYGLRLAIEQVIGTGGWVTISSYDSELRWGPDLWQHISQVVGEDIRAHKSLRSLVGELGPGVERTPSHKDIRRQGYWRRFADGLRGVRISFELPFSR